MGSVRCDAFGEGLFTAVALEMDPGTRIFTGIVKLRLTAVFDAQHGGFETGWSPISWGSIAELFVNLTMPKNPRSRHIQSVLPIQEWLEVGTCGPRHGLRHQA